MMTLKKISHLTGFSISTVSKALNDGYDISNETRKMIRDIAFKNNYVPNKNAVALRKSKSNIIAVILPQVNDVLYSETLYNMQKEASKLGFRIMLFQSFEEVSKEKEYLDEINDGSVDAAIVLSATKKEKTAEDATISNFPVEYIQILKNQSHDILKATCISNFGNLLKQIK